MDTDNKDRAIGRLPDDKPSAKKGKKYILTIGIDAYTHHRSLINAVADANAFAEVLINRYGFEHLDEPLLNDKATQRNIRKALGKCKTLTEQDQLIVFYSGHGYYETAAKLGYLVPIDAEDDPHSDFIPVNFVTNIFKGLNVQHILLVVDCCFGGSFNSERNVSVSDMSVKVIADLDSKKSRRVLSSGGIEPVSDGLVVDNNSPFTKPLVEILASNEEPQMIFSDFFPLLRQKTKWNAKQLPQYEELLYLGHAGGELALFCTDLESPEERAFKTAMETQSISLLEKFLRDFKQSEHKVVIRALLKEKRATEAWDKIKNSKFIEDFDEFIDNFTDSPFAQSARLKIDDLELADEETERKKREKTEKEAAARRERERLDSIENQQVTPTPQKPPTPIASKSEKVKVILVHPGNDKIRAIKIVRKYMDLSLSLQDGKDIVDNVPSVLFENIEQQNILEMLNDFKEINATIRIEPYTKPLVREPKPPIILPKKFDFEPEMVLVKGGTFKMSENYEVTLSDFSIGKFPITQSQWKAVMGDNPRHFKGDENCPVDRVSWDDIQVFVKKLNDKTDKKYRLPTEAEWEYAARGGRQSEGFEYSGSNNIEEVAWYWENSGDKKLTGDWQWDKIEKNNGRTHPVGTKKGNELGIHDMSGNVWEWCSDWYGAYSSGAVNNPAGATEGDSRVNRGGSWAFNAANCRVSSRNHDLPAGRNEDVGFRLVSSL